MITNQISTKQTIIQKNIFLKFISKQKFIKTDENESLIQIYI